MIELTKAEEQVMQVLWELDQAFVKEVIEHMPEPKPAYNTVSTIIRILEKKGAVDHEAFGKSHRYFPKIDKKDYSLQQMKKLKSNYFSNSAKKMISFLVEEKDISIKDMEAILAELNKNKKG